MISFLKRLFTRAPAVAPLETSEDATLFLGRLFHGHGAKVKIREGWVSCVSANMRSQVRIIDHPPPNAGYLVQLDVETRVTGCPPILESMAGLGKSRRDAIVDAFKSYCDGSFHVIFSAFCGSVCSHCTVDRWEIGGTVREVFVGPTLRRASGNDAKRIPSEWFASIYPEILRLQISPGVHSIRLYHCESSIASTISEALLDGVDCPELRSALTAYSWPPAEEFYSVRVFMVIR